MRAKSLQWSTLALVLIMSRIVVGDTGTFRLAAQDSSSDEAYVQVSSVTVEPSTIHKVNSPNETTVVVQIILGPRVPPDSTAKVAVGTYSTDPPGNNLTYDPVQTVSLNESPVTVKLKARTGPQTGAGKLIVAASIIGATNGVKVKPPQDPKAWQAKLLIADP